MFLFGVAHFPKHTKHGNEVQTSISQDMRPPSLKPEVVISMSGIREPRHSRQHAVCSSAASLTFKDMLCNCWKSIIKEIQHPLISPPHHTLLWFLRPSRARKLEKSAEIICAWNACSEAGPKWFFSICCQAPLMQSRQPRTQSE